MGRLHLDTRDRANSMIIKFYPEINSKLQQDSSLAATYTIESLATDFSKELGRSKIYRASSMSDILSRNGLKWSRKKRQIIQISDSIEKVSKKNYEMVSNIYTAFIICDTKEIAKTIRKHLLLDRLIKEDILAALIVPKGLLIYSNAKNIKAIITDKMNSIT